MPLAYCDNRFGIWYMTWYMPRAIWYLIFAYLCIVYMWCIYIYEFKMWHVICELSYQCMSMQCCLQIYPFWGNRHSSSLKYFSCLQFSVWSCILPLWGTDAWKLDSHLPGCFGSWYTLLPCRRVSHMLGCGYKMATASTVCTKICGQSAVSKDFFWWMHMYVLPFANLCLYELFTNYVLFWLRSAGEHVFIYLFVYSCLFSFMVN